MNEFIFSWAEDANGKMVHVDSVPRGLNCNCRCPYCHEQLQARQGKIREHGFKHHSKERGANLKICYMVSLYKLAEQIIQQEKKIHVPSYYGIFKDEEITFEDVQIDDRYDRSDKQPDVIGTTQEGEQYLIEFKFDYKVQHKEKIDYQNLNCIEVDLSGQTFETLEKYILCYKEGKKWVNSQTYFDQIEQVYANHGKQVKIVNEEECVKCELKECCCGIRLKKYYPPIKIENSGEWYRVCKVVEFENMKKKLEEEKKRKDFLSQDYDGSQNNIVEKEEWELEENENINPMDRTCFMCMHNLEWKCNDGFACCELYIWGNISNYTDPYTAQICKGFRIKLK